MTTTGDRIRTKMKEREKREGKRERGKEGKKAISIGFLNIIKLSLFFSLY